MAAVLCGSSPDGLYRVVLPYRPRGGRGLRYNVYPFPVTEPYTWEEAVLLLRAFNDRWLLNGVWPPPALEPWAEEIFPGECVARPEYERRRKLASFTLREYFRYVEEEIPFRRQEPIPLDDGDEYDYTSD